MKTAMKSLLDIIDKSIANAHDRKANGLEPIDYINTELSIYNYYRIIIERDMLEKEKIAIADAYIKGKHDALDNIEKTGFEYFDQTYNQNK